MVTSSFCQTHLEVLKPKDVQDADRLEVVFAPDADVELGDDPVETLGIKCHGHGVSGVHRLQEEEPNTAVTLRVSREPQPSNRLTEQPTNQPISHQGTIKDSFHTSNTSVTATGEHLRNHKTSCLHPQTRSCFLTFSGS